MFLSSKLDLCGGDSSKSTVRKIFRGAKNKSCFLPRYIIYSSLEEWLQYPTFFLRAISSLLFLLPLEESISGWGEEIASHLMHRRLIRYFSLKMEQVLFDDLKLYKLIVMEVAGTRFTSETHR